MSKQKYTIEALQIAVAENVSIAGVLRQLGLRPIGGNYRTIHRLIEHNNLDTSHFTGQGWNVGLAFKPKRAIPNEEIFRRDSNYKCSWRLRERYKIATGITSCENCGLSSWQGVPIPLEIHHINGNNTDNRLDNLQLLCPNCHALTDNYRGRAQLSALSEKRDVECRKFKEALTGKADGNLEPSLRKKEGAETRHDTPNG
ncbi:MAG: HNH endonuclease [Bacteroidales bacterium]|nr:HNH endonuclease [Bacteroidales bacterium]